MTAIIDHKLDILHSFSDVAHGVLLKHCLGKVPSKEIREMVVSDLTTLLDGRFPEYQSPELTGKRVRL